MRFLVSGWVSNKYKSSMLSALLLIRNIRGNNIKIGSFVCILHSFRWFTMFLLTLLTQPYKWGTEVCEPLILANIPHRYLPECGWQGEKGGWRLRVDSVVWSCQRVWWDLHEQQTIIQFGVDKMWSRARLKCIVIHYLVS